MKTWILSIAATGILSALATTVAPKTSVSNTVRLCCGTLMVLCVLSPVKKIMNSGFELESASKKRMSVSKEEILAQNEAFKSDIIKEHLTAYILKRTKQMGIDCEVSVGVGTDEEGNAVPNKISIICKENEQKKLREIIRDECGIDPIFRTNGKE